MLGWWLGFVLFSHSFRKLLLRHSLLNHGHDDDDDDDDDDELVGVLC